ncbi:S8 family peptidase, partial [uncultured Tateyamaria sp.]|uniref:S8 family peptidase n=1 Tax=uncultured Tateyamaria sp. TaxID=455651 RepID=UPI002606B714
MIGIKGSRSHFNNQRTAIIMRPFKTLALTTTAIVTLATAVSANIYAGQLTSFSDRQILNYLVSEYAREPSTFEDAHAYIILNRPGIMEDYLSQTLDQAPDTRSFSFSEPSARDTSGIGSMIVLGVVGMAAAASLAGGDDPGNSGPRPPSPSPSPRPSPSPSPGPGPDDAAYYQTREFNRNYGLSLIGADERYAKGAKGEGVKIAILDTGIDTDHPDFEGKIDPSSYSFFRNSTDISDYGGHGTHVAGIAAGGKDGRGTHGVAFESKLLILQGLGHLSASINRSIQANAHVINHSWVYTKTVGDKTVAIPITDFKSGSHLEQWLGSATIKALKDAKAADLMSVFAAGNDDGAPEVSNLAGIPHLLPDYNGYIIAVVAVDGGKNIAGFSNHCGVAMHFCLAAPGSGILSANNGGGVRYDGGTSMAAPHVTGAYAVLKSQWSDLTAPVIAQILFEAAEDLGDPGVDPIYGQGLLNLERAMRPMGELVVYQGKTTESDAMPLAKTGIVASGALAPALNQALAGQVLMVADKYTRGFDLAA